MDIDPIDQEKLDRRVFLATAAAGFTLAAFGLLVPRPRTIYAKSFGMPRYESVKLRFPTAVLNDGLQRGGEVLWGLGPGMITTWHVESINIPDNPGYFLAGYPCLDVHLRRRVA